MDDIRIGLWGGPGSGKTHYIVMLYKDILARSHQGFSIEELPDSDSFSGFSDLISSYIAGEDPTPPVYASDLGDRFVARREWLPRTPDDAEGIETYRFRIHCSVGANPGKGGETDARSLLLTVTDAGGAWYRTPFTMLQKYGKVLEEAKKPNPIKLLQDCQGIICLFDSAVGIKGEIAIASTETEEDYSAISPENRPLTREEMSRAFRDLCRFLKDNQPYDYPDGKLTQPLALCLSKIDQPGLWERRECPQKLEEWADIQQFPF